MTKYEKIKQILCRHNLPDYRYNQIIHAIFNERRPEYGKMSSLPEELRYALATELGDQVCTLVPLEEREKEQVGKLLFALPDQKRIEAVRLRYRRGWESFCISSQCGCGFGCRFCATGAIGLKRHLTAEEITDQVLYFHLKGYRLDSISFMGMGEALANPHIFEALAQLTDPALFGIGQRRITLSTIGLVPGIHKMTQLFPQVNLAFSLHSPFQEQRSGLMPVNVKYPLHQVMDELDKHIEATGRRVFVAYILLRDLNDTKEHAEALAALIKNRGTWARLYHIDLIPYNPTDRTAQKFRASSQYRVRLFSEALKEAGLSVTVRAQFGSGLEAACGQLYGGQDNCGT